MSQKIDAREFRNALASFATGVTVITCLDANGKPVGATASSFNSVSMDPPLILWSITKTANSADAFINAKEFVVNVLSTEQIDLSNQFSRSNSDKFKGVETATGIGQVPMLAGSVTCFQCKSWATYDGGDHEIIVGEVVAMDTNNDEGLIFYRGDYAKAEKL
ncbi:MAG: flavin reductase family protein, partial [Gammaproteobacteria bacterium]|nr:flavin reductase family protein [Gammaproteobacteria bacterium]